MIAVPKAKNKFDAQVYARLLTETLPKAIETEAECNRALAAIDELMSLDEKDLTTEQGMLLNLLATIVENYEDKHYPMPNLSPHDFLKQLMADREVKQKDLLPVFGSSGVASEVINGKRAISKAQAKKLAELFNLSVELFIS